MESSSDQTQESDSAELEDALEQPLSQGGEALDG
jgi:hypothetical protein